MKDIRMQDAELVRLLEAKLQEYGSDSIPRDQLEEMVASFIYKIRQSSRQQQTRIYLKENSYWENEKKILLYENKEVYLTNKERAFLDLLFSNMNEGVAYNAICKTLWNEKVDSIKQERIKTMVKQIRKKLPQNIIKNIFGFGYKIDLNMG